MHPLTISITSKGAFLALIVILLVWQPVSLQNIIQVHVMLFWYSYSS